MVVGAHAVMAHGFPRTSTDIDFVVHVPFSEEPKVEAMLRGLGHEEIERRKDEWGRRLVVESDGLEIEVFLTPTHPVYDREYDRRVVLDYRGEPIPFLSPEDLVVRKLVNTKLRRGHDFDDAIGVLVVQRDRIDRQYLRTHCGFYRVGELLERAIKEAEAADA